jgi:phage baseplate assembly protein W
MANLLSRFYDQVVGSDNKIRDYIAIISSRGDFQRIEDLNVILSSWNNILLTPRRTYILDPQFGSDLYKYVFEPVDENTIEGIRNEVIERLSFYDDRASIVDVQVRVMSNGKGYVLDITADYDGTKGSLTVSFDDTTFADFLTETSQ